MRSELADKVALVTGSGQRVGRAIALELARRGAHQLIHYHSSVEKAQQTIAEVQALGVRAVGHHADLSDSAQVDGLFAAVQAAYGRIDILVNSAAIFDRGDLATLSLDDWQRSLSVNLTGPFLCTQHAVAAMRRNQGPNHGAIVNICDGSVSKGFVNYPQHSVSKAGLMMLTRLSARSFGPDIRVNAVVVGRVLRSPDYDIVRWNNTIDRVPLKRAGDAEDVARAVTYLVEEDYLTGTFLTVDGGESLI